MHCIRMMLPTSLLYMCIYSLYVQHASGFYCCGLSTTRVVQFSKSSSPFKVVTLWYILWYILNDSFNCVASWQYNHPESVHLISHDIDLFCSIHQTLVIYLNPRYILLADEEQ